MLLVIVGVQKSGDTVIMLKDDARPESRIYTSLDDWEDFIKQAKAGDYDLDKLLKD